MGNPLLLQKTIWRFRFDQRGVAQLHFCNHEEADSRIALHATLDNVDCVIVSKDTDVFLLLIYASINTSHLKVGI